MLREREENFLPRRELLCAVLDKSCVTLRMSPTEKKRRKTHRAKIPKKEYTFHKNT